MKNSSRLSNFNIRSNQRQDRKAHQRLDVIKIGSQSFNNSASLCHTEKTVEYSDLPSSPDPVQNAQHPEGIKVSSAEPSSQAFSPRGRNFHPSAEVTPTFDYQVKTATGKPLRISQGDLAKAEHHAANSTPSQVDVGQSHAETSDAIASNRHASGMAKAFDPRGSLATTEEGELRLQQKPAKTEGDNNNTRLAKYEDGESPQKIELNLKNLKRAQIEKLLELKIISRDQALNAMSQNQSSFNNSLISPASTEHQNTRVALAKTKIIPHKQAKKHSTSRNVRIVKHLSVNPQRPIQRDGVLPTPRLKINSDKMSPREFRTRRQSEKKKQVSTNMPSLMVPPHLMKYTGVGGQRTHGVGQLKNPAVLFSNLNPNQMLPSDFVIRRGNLRTAEYQGPQSAILPKSNRFMKADNLSIAMKEKLFSSTTKTRQTNDQSTVPNSFQASRETMRKNLVLAFDSQEYNQGQIKPKGRRPETQDAFTVNRSRIQKPRGDPLGSNISDVRNQNLLESVENTMMASRALENSLGEPSKHSRQAQDIGHASLMTQPDLQRKAREEEKKNGENDSYLSNGQFERQKTAMEAALQDNKLDMTDDLAEEMDIRNDIERQLNDKLSNQSKSTSTRNQNIFQNIDGEEDSTKKGDPIQLQDNSADNTGAPNSSMAKRKRAPAQPCNPLEVKEQSTTFSANFHSPIAKKAHSLINPLHDGRKHGYFNPGLVPPLQRPGNRDLDPVFKTKKLKTLVVKKDSIGPDSDYLKGPNSALVFTKPRLAFPKNSEMKSRLLEIASRAKSVDRQIQREIPFQYKINKLTQRLHNINSGLSHEAQMLNSTKMHQIMQRAEDLQMAASPLIQIKKNTLFSPPFGHTKLSLIRHEISNFENVAELPDPNIPTLDLKEIKGMKELSLQGRMNTMDRVSKYARTPRDRSANSKSPPMLQTHRLASVEKLQKAADPSKYNNSVSVEEYGRVGTVTPGVDAQAKGDPLLEKSLQETSRLDQSSVKVSARQPSARMDGSFAFPRRNTHQTVTHTPNPEESSGLHQRRSTINTQTRKTSGIDGLYTNQGRNVGFSSQYQNVWVAQPRDMMFTDTRLQSDAVRQEREARCLMVSLERQVSKMERIRSKETKEQMLKFYKEKFDIVLPESKVFFLDADRLKELLIKKASQVTMERAAIKIQKWFRHKKNINSIFFMVQKIIKSVVLLQRMYKRWKSRVGDPSRNSVQRLKAARVIQKYMKGYQSRRKCLYLLLEARSNSMYAYFSKLDRVAKTQFQRRVRRAWFKYKENKEMRKKLEEASSSMNLKKRQSRVLKKQMTSFVGGFGGPKQSTLNLQRERAGSVAQASPLRQDYPKFPQTPAVIAKKEESPSSGISNISQATLPQQPQTATVKPSLGIKRSNTIFNQPECMSALKLGTDSPLQLGSKKNSEDTKKDSPDKASPNIPSQPEYISKFPALENDIQSEDSVSLASDRRDSFQGITTAPIINVPASSQQSPLKLIGQSSKTLNIAKIKEFLQDDTQHIQEQEEEHSSSDEEAGKNSGFQRKVRLGSIAHKDSESFNVFSPEASRESILESGLQTPKSAAKIKPIDEMPVQQEASGARAEEPSLTKNTEESVSRESEKPQLEDSKDKIKEESREESSREDSREESREASESRSQPRDQSKHSSKESKNTSKQDLSKDGSQSRELSKHSEQKKRETVVTVIESVDEIVKKKRVNFAEESASHDKEGSQTAKSERSWNLNGAQLKIDVERIKNELAIKEEDSKTSPSPAANRKKVQSPSVENMDASPMMIRYKTYANDPGVVDMKSNSYSFSIIDSVELEQEIRKGPAWQGMAELQSPAVVRLKDELSQGSDTPSQA